ncbi:nucleotide-binding protein [Woodsholea maritima]|uniref:nucleotide-binding protein n=1 Tax=Woodsholea maritima TaxID=240237 RepID=UPI000373E8AD|nr:AAA family ATPase [Woodsholea maritima]
MNRPTSASTPFPQNGPRTAGRILAVASGKGGVGKTVISTSLSRGFSRLGERVLLVDADLGMANVDVQMGITPAGDLASVVSGRMTLQEALSPVLGGSKDRGGFDVLPGQSGSGALAGLDMDTVNDLAANVAAVALSYDRTILDLAAGAERTNIRLAIAADDVLIIINDEPTSLTDAYAFVKTLRMRDEGASPFIVVNGAPSRKAAEQAYLTFARTCESFLSFRPPLAGIIRRDPHVPQAIRTQTPVSVRYPTSDASADLERLANALATGVKHR